MTRTRTTIRLRKGEGSDRARSKAAARTTGAFPVVGLGASAGGLDALEEFLRSVPAPNDAAFVVVQHLDPTQKGMLVELLQRASPLPVVQAKDGLRVRAGHVYVIPPNTDLSIAGGALRLSAPTAPRGQRLPIDFFFRSLANECGAGAIAVVLSGMGSDGTAGARAVRANGGGVFVQEPRTAAFDAMPRSVVDAGLADVAAPPGALAANLRAFLTSRGDGSPRASERIGPPIAPSALANMITALRLATGHDFANYKTSTVERRVARRMALHELTDPRAYVRYLSENPKEAQLLFGELLIGVTTFFRDPAEWERLKAQALAERIAATPRGGTVRAWVPACSTGEEAYSVAILLLETLAGASAGEVRVQVFATDLDPIAIGKARKGHYPKSIAGDVSPARLARYFREEEHGYRVRKEVRDRVIFATQNVLQDPPFTNLDLLACRNLLIYLSAVSQRRLLPLFHYALRPGGFLFLGSAETASGFAELFAPLDPKSRIYRRLDVGAGAPAVDFPSASARPSMAASDDALARAPADAPKSPNLHALMSDYLLTHFAPAAVLTSRKGDVLCVSGRTGPYLELPPGKVSWNLLAMARDGLRRPITVAFQEALRTGGRIKLRGLEARDGEEPSRVDVTVEPMREPEALRGTLVVVFAACASVVAAGAGKGARKGARARPPTVTRLERALGAAQGDLRTAREEMQASDEALKSTNEELQSTNEELQSTNEELTTSKEEMQSMNEELQSVNHELQAKLDELSKASDDMKNLLDSTEIATLFLDGGLNVRRFTPQAANLIKLLPVDVGRPITDLASEFDYPALGEDAREVLRTLVFREKVVATTDGREFRARIMPYRTLDNRIDGVVITFTRDTQRPGALP